MAASGDTFVSGARFDDEHEGSVPVFTHVTRWAADDNVVRASPTAPRSCFGGSVALSGDVMLVGAPYAGNGIDCDDIPGTVAASTGAVFLSHRVNGRWTLPAVKRRKHELVWARFRLSVRADLRLEHRSHPTGTLLAGLNVLNVQGGSATGAIVRSTDGGVTWTSVLTADEWLATLRRCEADPAQLYATVDGHVARAEGLRGLAIPALSSPGTDPARAWLTSWGSGLWTRASSSDAWTRVPLSRLSADFVHFTAADPFQPGRLFVGAGSLFVSTDDGEHFVRQDVGGNPNALAFDPNDRSALYLGTQTLGMLKTTDAGGSWQAINGALQPWPTSAGTFIDVRSLALDPGHAQVIYAGTNGRGVYKSTDGGANCENVLGPGQVIRCLAFLPGNPGTLYARADGVQGTTDGGATWFDASGGLPDLEVGRLLADEASATLYASTDQGAFMKRPEQDWVGLDTTCLPSAGAMTIRAKEASRSCWSPRPGRSMRDRSM